MTELFRNSSPGALTMQQAIALEKKRLAERRRQKRLAQELAAQGRSEDTEIAHVARGEFVVPEALQTPELMAALHQAAVALNIPLERFRIGDVRNSINPTTGAPEFWMTSPVELGGDDATERNEHASSNRLAQNIQMPSDNDNLAGGVCRTAGYECLEHAQGDTQTRACHTAEQACQEAARAAPNFPENTSVVARFPHGRTVVIPGGRAPPYLGPFTPRRY